jgi:hypothetical protein
VEGGLDEGWLGGGLVRHGCLSCFGCSDFS